MFTKIKLKLTGANDSLADLKKHLAEMEKIADNEIDNLAYEKERNSVECHIQELQNRLSELKREIHVLEKKL